MNRFTFAVATLLMLTVVPCSDAEGFTKWRRMNPAICQPHQIQDQYVRYGYSGLKTDGWNGGTFFCPIPNTDYLFLWGIQSAKVWFRGSLSGQACVYDVSASIQFCSSVVSGFNTTYTDIPLDIPVAPLHTYSWGGGNIMLNLANDGTKVHYVRVTD